MNTVNQNDYLLKLENLSIAFDDPKTGHSIQLTDEVSFGVKPGEVFGLVGESGCGKTVSSLAILRLLPLPILRIAGGQILYKDKDLKQATNSEMRKLRGNQIGIIFQEPAAALNPLYTIEKQLLEIFNYHPFDGDPVARIHKLLERTGIADPPRVLKSYPHELSGGMLQRVMITLSLIFDPQLLIADEPTTALDVTVQAQIMALVKELQREKKMAVLLITHNMGLIAQYADRVAVMYAGRIVEE